MVQFRAGYGIKAFDPRERHPIVVGPDRKSLLLMGMRLSLLQKRILVVSHDSGLRASRSALLVAAGYAVATASNPDQAIELLDANTFDLVLIGRRSLVAGKPLDQRLRERYPEILILKIAEVIEEGSRYPTKTTISVPANVLAALKGMLP
jgi:hypothetical protein